jgi:hypothetical protein
MEGSPELLDDNEAATYQPAVYREPLTASRNVGEVPPTPHFQYIVSQVLLVGDAHVAPEGHHRHVDVALNCQGGPPARGFPMGRRGGFEKAGRPKATSP